jgi:hypothetical protein
MCDCNKHTRIGNYGNQVIILPFWKRDFISVDRCLLDELCLLWSLEIVTNGCCCGHNQREGYIGVWPEHIEIMQELGYKSNYPNDYVFKPKSI